MCLQMEYLYLIDYNCTNTCTGVVGAVIHFQSVKFNPDTQASSP